MTGFSDPALRRKRHVFTAVLPFARHRGLGHYAVMSSDPENLTLVFLRRIDAKIDTLALDLRELKERVSGVEIGLTSVRRDIAGLAETDARLQVSLDRMRDDVGRIQRRLDLHEEPAA